MDTTNNVVQITSKSQLEHYYRSRSNVYLHLYEIGDLDDFFWSKCQYMGLVSPTGEILFVILIYKGVDPPVLLAFGEDLINGTELLKRLRDDLPSKFYSHISPNLFGSLEIRFKRDQIYPHYKMSLEDFSIFPTINTSIVERLTIVDLDPILEFYKVAYPENWFDPHMLESMQTFGIRAHAIEFHSLTPPLAPSTLVAIAGIHTFTQEFRVAVLGNVAVHPQYQQKGLAKLVISALLKSVTSPQVGVTDIGLNVSVENNAAIACYSKLGFVVKGMMEEGFAVEKEEKI